MRYYRRRVEGERSLVAADGDAVYDLTAVRPELRGFGDLARAAAVADVGVDDVAERHLDAAPTLGGVPDDLATPLTAPEVWAAGVTYRISEEAREDESGMPELYLDVYDAERPELFLKATPARTVGPGGDVGVRADSDWDVPEPELGVVLYRGDVVGYTAGNDVSSRDIEGANPLYLPQAKVYDRCCALGPAVASPSTVGDPHDLALSMTIERDGERVYEGEASTGDMVRRCEDLVEWLTAHDELPDLTVLLTGTSLVPPDEFTLREGDRVRITLESVGTLTNGVTEV
ncbi:MAG: fumarylacetoacetate hydrolase family protein [Haloferacaceae archaeon]